MWTVCPKLRFDSSILRDNIYGTKQYAQKFINNVNSILQQHHGKLVEVLEVQIEFNAMLIDHLNNWVSFATSSHPKNLAFDLAPKNFGGRDDHYIFPFELLDTSRLQSFQVSFVSLKLPSHFSGFCNLKKLDLHILHVSRKDLQDMLSSCPSLEWLSLVRCYLNDELKFDRPSTTYYTWK